MKKVPFITQQQAKELTKKYPTPFHLYDEKGIRENARKVKQAFSCPFPDFGKHRQERFLPLSE